MNAPKGWDLSIWKRLLLRWFTNAGNKVNVAVTNGASFVDVTWARAESDAVYGVMATPNWSTTVYTSNKASTGCRINFGTAAGAGAKVDVAVFRTED